MAREIRSRFVALPPQAGFLNSTAKIRGYGGAMGGGKSRTLCEDKFDEMIDYPGIVVVLARQAHTSIIETTKKTMLNQVIPPEAIARKKESGGEDYIELVNGSRCHFIGLDDPLRWYSSELGSIGFDEAQEIKEDVAVRLMTRLRQPGMTHRATFTFNPSSPGHWLQSWFLLGGQVTDHGFYKPELYANEATSPFGDAEFFFAKATDNIHLPEGYVEQTLSGLPERLRRRYLEGLWEFTEGNGFFEADTLKYYEGLAHTTKPLFNGRLKGDPEYDWKCRREKKKPEKDKAIRIVKGDGPVTVWKLPKRDIRGKNGENLGKGRYVMSIDVSSGGSYDFSAIQVISVDDFEQVAEFQGKIVPSELAIVAYQLGRVYNNALAVPEITGGWGETIKEELRRQNYPNPYTRKMLDRLTRRWSDRVGWDTTAKSRAHMLDSLERVLREREFGLYSLRAVSELATFVYGKNNKPEAQEGCNDDLVVALAIAVTVALEQPRQLRRPKKPVYEPQFSATGY